MANVTRALPKEIIDVRPLIQDDLFLFIMSISLGIVCQTVTVFGTASNIVSLVIFSKQGFSDCINISLFSLALSDLFSLLTLLWSNLCFTPAFRDSDIPLATSDVHLITGSLPHVVFTRISGWITAFISFERCVCVVLPLEIKILFTRKRHVLAMLSIYFLTLASHSIACFLVALGWVYYPQSNKTLIGLVYLTLEDRQKVAVEISHAVNGVFMPVSCFLSVVVCTVFLVVKLHEKAAWRNSHSSATLHSLIKDEPARASTRDQRAAKMIVLISAMFIACFTPSVITFVAGFVEPEFNFNGLYKNMFLVILSASFSTEALSSSVNVFIYYVMSSKYRHSFRRLLNCR